MNRREHDLEQAEQDFWLDGGGSHELARTVVERALGATPRNPRILLRSIQIAHVADLPPAFARRVKEDLEPAAETMRTRLRLLDQLGDDKISPEQAVFDLLPALGEIDFEALDLESLKANRSTRTGTPQRAETLLETLGWNRLPDDTQESLRSLTAALVAASKEFQAQALLVAGGHGLVLGARVYAEGGSGVEAMDSADSQMTKQGRIALSPYAEGQRVRWSLEWPLTYEGASIGLALKVAGMVAAENLPSDPLLAATGKVDESGTVKWVNGIEQKLRAAREAGIQRVLLPEENRDEVEGLEIEGLPELLYVTNVAEVRRRLAEASAKGKFSLEGRVRHVKAAMAAENLEAFGDRDISHGRQFRVADAQSEATVQVWDGAKSKLTVGGSPGSARDLAERVRAEIVGTDAERKREPCKWKVAAPARRAALTKALDVAGAEPQANNGQSEEWRYLLQRPGSQAQATLWATGTLRAQGEGEAFDQLVAVIERELSDLPNAKVSEPGQSTAAVLESLSRDLPWAGTDESGKGDYFGPLVSAAVIVDAPLAEQLKAMGVQDSKKLTDARVHKLAPELRRLLQGRYDLTPINPPTFNSLYAEMKKEGKNMNTLLAWGHARSIEDLLGKGMKPSYVIVDKFAADASYMERKLLADTREAGIKLVQVTKAEADIAVAAASILAREAFLNWLQKNSKTLGMKLPKGAGSQVKEAARRIVASRGEDALGDYAKLFFKTTKEVLAA